VTLDDQEKVQVAKLVVRALKRDLDTLEVGGARVRRPRKAKYPGAASSTTTTASPTVRRRKRGSLLA
jgi:hypothetical protein